MSQLSSFLRIGPIPSHNLIKTAVRVGGYVYSLLCTISLGLHKNAFNAIAKPCFGEKQTFFDQTSL